MLLCQRQSTSFLHLWEERAKTGFVLHGSPQKRGTIYSQGGVASAPSSFPFLHKHILSSLFPSAEADSLSDMHPALREHSGQGRLLRQPVRRARGGACCLTTHAVYSSGNESAVLCLPGPLPLLEEGGLSLVPGVLSPETL